jgi:hydrogenase nickel incorporation protein HypA/HybF
LTPLRQARTAAARGQPPPLEAALDGAPGAASMGAMHEWALAEATVEAVRSSAGGRRVLGVRLAFGELQQVDRDLFAAAVADLAPAAGIEAAVFTVDGEPARFACRACGRPWALAEAQGLSEDDREAVHLLPEAAHAYLRCPGCGSPDFDVVAGRGVTITSIELEEPEAAPS